MSEQLWEDKKHYLWWPISFTKYTVDYNTLYVTSGLITTRYDELLLYRILDCKCTISLFQRMFGTGTVHLIGYDSTTPVLQLKNIRNPLEVKNLISKLAIANRRNAGVVEIG